MELTGLLDGVDLDFFMSDIIYPDKLTKILGTKVSVDTIFAPFIHTHALMDTSVKTKTQTHTLLIRNTRAQFRGSAYQKQRIGACGCREFCAYVKLVTQVSRFVRVPTPRKLGILHLHSLLRKI